MIDFVVEFIRWVRARCAAKRLEGRPYFWGAPTYEKAANRYQAFLYASGLSNMPPDMNMIGGD